VPYVRLAMLPILEQAPDDTLGSAEQFAEQIEANSDAPNGTRTQLEWGYVPERHPSFWVVVSAVAGSNPVAHPLKSPAKARSVRSGG